MAKKDLNFWQRIYLPEIIRGMWITARHFFANLCVHLLHLVGLSRSKKGMVTYQWPEEYKPMPRRLRARHRLMKRQDGSTRCVACMMCETICPARCIYIVGEPDPNPRIEKRPKSFEIDLGICIVCGYCVEACPEDAIRMDSYDLETASYSRGGMILTLKELLDHNNEDLYPPSGRVNPAGKIK
jgi:NADH-quinone oxidoreductase subunit I